MGTKASTSPGASVQAPSETMSNPFSVSGSSKAKSDGIRLSAIDRADSIWNLFGRPVSSRTEMSASAPRSFSFPRPGNFWLRKQGPHVAGPSTIVGFEGNAVHRLQSGRSSAAAQIAHATVSHCYVDFWTLARLIAINRICLFHLFLRPSLKRARNVSMYPLHPIDRPSPPLITFWRRIVSSKARSVILQHILRNGSRTLAMISTLLRRR